MIRHNKEVIIKPAYYEAEPNDSYQAVWLCNFMNEHDLSCCKMAKILKVTKQTTSNWLHDRAQMTFAHVYALCKEFNLTDDPYEIYQKMRG